MLDAFGHQFDQATRDYHHALRRLQRRRATSIAHWVIVPPFIAAAVTLAAFCLQ
jgi:hypothetical protein